MIARGRGVERDGRPLSERALAAIRPVIDAAEPGFVPAVVEEGAGVRLWAGAREYRLERLRGGRWLEVRRGRWLLEVLGIAWGEGRRLEGPAAVALPWASETLANDAALWRGEVRPASWRKPERSSWSAAEGSP